MLRKEYVRPASSSQWRVSCTTASPDSSTIACRSASYSSARTRERSEFMFLISARVPSLSVPTGRSEMLASMRSDPSSIFTSDTPMASSTPRSSAT